MNSNYLKQSLRPNEVDRIAPLSQKKEKLLPSQFRNLHLPKLESSAEESKASLSQQVDLEGKACGNGLDSN